ncbi:hypothetical protein [Mycobacterium sp.]|uniref:hypothetical protein n=1 Tax=Mycobacterium sp. TaxID=1785 RepID=UPI003F96E760
MTETDNDRPISGDVIPAGIRRVTGEPGSDAGLIEVPLYAHRYRYQVRVVLAAGTAPRLVELHMVADDDSTADLEPNFLRSVPVRRLAAAAARFIVLTEGGVELPEADDTTALLRPDRSAPGSGKRPVLDDAHYRQVANLLLAAREIGLPPRDYVVDRFGASLPTVDRWIAEAKRRRFLPRDWARAADTTATADTTAPKPEQETDR